MKYKKILISLATVASIVGCMTAFAADYTADERGVVVFNETFDVSELNKYAEFDGHKYTFGDYDKYLTYRVVDMDNNLQNFGQVELDDTGNVNFSFRIKGNTGEYKLILSNMKLLQKTYTIDYVNNVYIEFNDVKAQNDAVAMDEFITSNGELFKFDTDAYALLSETKKAEIAQAYISSADAASMDDLTNIAKSVDVVNVLFETAEQPDVLVDFILGNVAKEDSLFNKAIVKVFSDKLSNDTDRIAVVSKIMGKPLDSNQMDVFEYEILKSYVSQIMYYEDMDEVILSDGNIWGFYADDLLNYEYCDKTSVKKEMRTAVNSVENLDGYRKKFTELIGYYPQQSLPVGGGSSGGSSGSGGGGSFSGGASSKNTYSLSGDDLVANTVEIKAEYPPAEEKISFNDLGNYEWAKEAIQVLADNYIVNGVSENEFQPSRTIKREEFVKLLTAGLRLTGAEANASFADVEKGDWYYEAVAAAERAELVNGDGNGNFGVGTEITRQDAVVLLSRTAEYKGVTLEPSVEITFTDNDSIAGYAKSAVSKLSKAGIINGMEDGSFSPYSALTRAEAAKMIYGLFKALSII